MYYLKQRHAICVIKIDRRQSRTKQSQPPSSSCSPECTPAAPFIRNIRRPGPAQHTTKAGDTGNTGDIGTMHAQTLNPAQPAAA
jgi:hypothetical protein